MQKNYNTLRKGKENLQKDILETKPGYWNKKGNI